MTAPFELRPTDCTGGTGDDGAVVVQSRFGQCSRVSQHPPLLTDAVPDHVAQVLLRADQVCDEPPDTGTVTRALPAAHDTPALGST